MGRTVRLLAFRDELGFFPRANAGAGELEHDPKKVCPGLDPGWIPVFEKIMLHQ
jgi:hypothetical protein